MTTHPATLEVGHLNGHNRTAAFAAMLRLRPDTLGTAEAAHVARWLAHRAGYRTVVPNTRPGDRAGDTVVLTRRLFDPIAGGSIRASEQVDRLSRIAPDRWLTWSGFDHPELGRVAHVAAHLNAGPKILTGHDENHPVVEEYAASVRVLERLLTWLEGERFSLVVTGDLNLAPIARPWSPYPVLLDHGLAVFRHRIDVIAAPKAWRRVSETVIAESRTGSDHAGLSATYRP